MDTSKGLFDDMKEVLTNQLKEAYMDGVHQGSITTCAVLYHTMATAGLEEDNFFFSILKDMAKMHGCEDIKAEIAELLSHEKTDSIELS